MDEELEVRNEELEESPPCLKGGGAERRGDIPSESDTLKPEQSAEDAEIPPPPAEAPPFRQGGQTPPPDYRAHFASLCAEGEAMEREIPGFSLEAALRDPDFLRLTSPAVGVSARRAWYALHGAERERAAAREAAESLARRVAANAARPREGGRGAAAGALCAAALDRESRAALRRRVYEAAARGEKVYP